MTEVSIEIGGREGKYGLSAQVDGLKLVNVVDVVCRLLWALSVDLGLNTDRR